MLQRKTTEERWHWWEMQLDPADQLPTEEPPQPEAGQGWYDPETHHVCIWDGMEWCCVPLD
jgi:hypothetical protein